MTEEFRQNEQDIYLIPLSDGSFQVIDSSGGLVDITVISPELRADILQMMSFPGSLGTQSFEVESQDSFPANSTNRRTAIGFGLAALGSIVWEFGLRGGKDLKNLAALLSASEEQASNLAVLAPTEFPEAKVAIEAESLVIIKNEQDGVTIVFSGPNNSEGIEIVKNTHFAPGAFSFEPISGFTVGESLGSFELTFYYKVLAEDYPGPANTPILDCSGRTIGMVSSSFYQAMRVEGTGGLTVDGDVYNIAGCGGWMKLSGSTYPWGIGVGLNYPLAPGRSVATDDSRISPGTWLFCPELVNLPLPDGSMHDGLVRSVDTGGGGPGWVDFFTGLEVFKGYFDARLPNSLTLHRVYPTQGSTKPDTRQEQPVIEIQSSVKDEDVRQQLIRKYGDLRPTEWGQRTTGVKTRLNIQHLSAQDKVIALTFDACGGSGGSGYDKKLIDFLIAEKIPATLFINGRWIDANPAVFQALAENRLFEIENHGLEHKPCSCSGRSAYDISGTNSVGEVYDEVEENARKIERLTGRKPRFYRSGTAYYDEVCTAVVRELGYEIAGFNIDGDGGTTYSASQVRDALLSADSGSVVLLHMNHPERETAEGVISAISELIDKDFRFVRIDECGLI